jgi:AcrR family transcriptional regulator
MAIPYEQTGRRNQKARTREALVAAARELLATGATPTVEDAAAAAAVSRTTAYRYFPNQRALVVAAHPEVDRTSLLPDDPPDDPEERLALVVAAAARIVLDWEAQLRASLRLSLEPGQDPTGPVLRRGRVIGWIEDALAPLAGTHPRLDRRGLAVAIRAATGIEAFVWMVDVAHLSREEAVSTMQWTARALLRSALCDGGPAARQWKADVDQNAVTSSCNDVPVRSSS